MTMVERAWDVRDFRTVWGASAVGGMGVEIRELALPVLALVNLGATAQELSWVRAGLFLPYLLLTLWLGVLVDRMRRRPLMVAAELGQGLLVLLIALLALSGLLTVPILVVGAVLLGSLAVLHMLADFSFLPHVVDARTLPSANAAMTATQSAIGIGGSGVGGGLVHVLTAPIALLLNGVSHLVAATLLGRVRVREPVSEREPGSIVQQVKQGVGTLARHGAVRALAAEATLWNFGNELFMLALTVVVLRERLDGPLVLGLVFMAGGLGAFVGAGASAWLTARCGYGPALIAALTVGNTAPAVGVLATRTTETASLVVLGAAFLLSGLGIGVANSQAVTVRQLAVPERLRGRVNAAYRLLSWGALAIGALLGGLAVNAWGPWTAALAGTLLMAISTLPVALSPVRRMRDLAGAGG